MAICDDIWAYWKMNETSGNRLDSSGNDHHLEDHPKEGAGGDIGAVDGICVNAVELTSVFTPHTRDYLDLETGYLPDLSSDHAFTLAFWFKPNNVKDGYNSGGFYSANLQIGFECWDYHEARCHPTVYTGSAYVQPDWYYTGLRTFDEPGGGNYEITGYRIAIVRKTSDSPPVYEVIPDSEFEFTGSIGSSWSWDVQLDPADFVAGTPSPGEDYYLREYYGTGDPIDWGSPSYVTLCYLYDVGSGKFRIKGTVGETGTYCNDMVTVRFYGYIDDTSTGWMHYPSVDFEYTPGAFDGSELTAPAENEWHYLFLLYDGTTLTLYIDNVNVGSNVDSTYMSDTETLAGIRAEYGATTLFDEMTLWTRALTEAERNWLWNDGNGRCDICALAARLDFMPVLMLLLKKK